MKRFNHLYVFPVLIFLFGLLIWWISCDLDTLSPSGIPEYRISWQQTNGPYGGSVYAVTGNSSGHIFAGGYGIYRSMDNGNSWHYSNLPGAKVHYLAVNEFNGDIYALTKDGTLRSNDGGETWKGWNIFPMHDEFNCIAFNSSGHIFAGADVDIFWSTDNGENWTRGDINSHVYTIVVLPNGHIFAGTRDGIFRSIDNGNNWKHYGLDVRVYALSITGDGNMFAGTRDGIYRSIDSGNNWTFCSFQSPVKSIVGNSSGHLFAKTYEGIFRSTDNGDSWEKLNVQTPVNGLAINSDNHIFIAGNGVFRSSHNGDAWDNLNANIYNSVDQIAASSNNHVFAIASRNLYRSLDNGSNWEHIKPFDSRVYSVGISPGNMVFISTADGVFRSVDNGDSWTKADNGLGIGSTRFFRFNSKGHIFTGRGTTSMMAITGIFRSTDYGNNWTLVSPVGGGESVEIVAQKYIIGNRTIQIEKLFAITEEGLIWSVDGRNWSKIELKGMGWISHIGSNALGHIFITAGNKIYRSTDYGGSWTVIKNVGENYIRSFAVNSQGHIFASTYSEIIYSFNNGRSWFHTNQVIHSYDVKSLSCSNESIFVGTRGGGVFRGIEK